MTADPAADPPARPPGGPAQIPAKRLQRNSRLLMISSVTVGLGNYVFYLVLLWLLPSIAFSEVSSASTLLVIVGTASSAVLPWLVARNVARTSRGSHQRRQAVGFSLGAAIVLGAAAGSVVAALSAPYAPTGVIVLLWVTSVELFVAGVGSGYLLGEERFWLLATLSVGEVAVKLGVGVTLATAGGGRDRSLRWLRLRSFPVGRVEPMDRPPGAYVADYPSPRRTLAPIRRLRRHPDSGVGAYHDGRRRRVDCRWC